MRKEFYEVTMAKSFRSSAGFGKRMEYKLVGDMLMGGVDCYLPLLDDHGVWACRFYNPYFQAEQYKRSLSFIALLF